MSPVESAGSSDSDIHRSCKKRKDCSENDSKTLRDQISADRTSRGGGCSSYKLPNAESQPYKLSFKLLAASDRADVINLHRPTLSEIRLRLQSWRQGSRADL